MTGLLAALARLLGGGLAQQLRAAYEARLAAANDRDRIAAEQRIAQLEAIQRTRIAGSGRWSLEIPCFIAGAAATGHFALVVYASTPFAPPGFVVHKLPAPMDEYQGAIILSFFGLSLAAAGVRALTMRR